MNAPDICASCGRPMAAHKVGKCSRCGHTEIIHSVGMEAYRECKFCDTVERRNQRHERRMQAIHEQIIDTLNKKAED